MQALSDPDQERYAMLAQVRTDEMIQISDDIQASLSKTRRW